MKRRRRSIEFLKLVYYQLIIVSVTRCYILCLFLFPQHLVLHTIFIAYVMQLELTIPKILSTNSFFTLTVDSLVNFNTLSQTNLLRFCFSFKKSFALSFILSESCDKMYEIVIWHPSTKNTIHDEKSKYLVRQKLMESKRENLEKRLISNVNTH